MENVIQNVYLWVMGMIANYPIDSVIAGIIYGVSLVSAFYLERQLWIEKCRPGKWFGMVLVVIDSILPVINTLSTIILAIRTIIKRNSWRWAKKVDVIDENINEDVDEDNYDDDEMNNEPTENDGVQTNDSISREEIKDAIRTVIKAIEKVL